MTVWVDVDQRRVPWLPDDRWLLFLDRQTLRRGVFGADRMTFDSEQEAQHATALLVSFGVPSWALSTGGAR
jgi:hypothetical protein